MTDEINAQWFATAALCVRFLDDRYLSIFCIFQGHDCEIHSGLSLTDLQRQFDDDPF
jgi:hypothetical protein